MKRKNLTAWMLTLCMTAGILAGCGGTSGKETQGAGESAGSAEPVKLVMGDTTFNAENEEADTNPHSAYAGWACIRYGIGETLFKINDNMELDFWIAESYELVDEHTWKIQIKDGVTFSNGKACDAVAVKACLEDLIAVHERAAGDLSIKSMETDGNVLTIVTEEARPNLLNYLSEPYGCIIDVEEGVKDGIVVGTGPYVGVEMVTDNHLTLKKNKNYWDGDVSVDEITVRTISDGDTLAMALQAGEIDMAYGMAYASYPLFENEDFTFSGTQTSRAFFCQMNFESSVVSDRAVRKAIAMGIDKEGFVNTLLKGYGYVGVGAFPDSFSFGGQNVTTETYDPEGAKKVLEEAGWVDTDGDGFREKDGQKLEIRWLTYPSRQELPLLAESAQATLKNIGINVIINCTADVNSIWKNTSSWDVYAGANVNAGLGDPMNFFSTHCLDVSTKNRGRYHSDNLEKLADQLENTFDKEERSRLAIEMQQEILNDNAFVFCSFLKMSMISRKGVTGLTAHPCDFYELTADLKVEK